MMRRAFWIVVKLAITAALLHFFFSKTDIKSVLDSLYGMSLTYFIILNVMNILGVYLNAYKWNLFLPDQSFRNLAKLNFISYYFAVLLPGQIAGEAAKAYILGKNNKSQIQKIAASVVIDKITSVVGLLIVGLAGLLL